MIAPWTLTASQDTGNKISRRAHIEGKQNIMLGGKSVLMAGVCLRGDLHRKAEKAAEGEKESHTTAISVGRYASSFAAEVNGRVNANDRPERA